MKATALLAAQHEAIRAFLKQLEKGDGHLNERLDQLANHLVAHMVIEQELFYPAVSQVKEDLILEAYEEHEVARFALDRVVKTQTSDRTFKAKVITLREIFEHHIAEEEKALFPAVEQALGEGSEALCAQMKSRFEETRQGGYERAIKKSQAAVNPSIVPAHQADGQTPSV